jgi:transposase
VGRIPRNHGPNVTCLAALTPTGITVPLVFKGALDGDVFVTWVQEWLAPSLTPGTTVVLDNLSVHKHHAARTAIAAAGGTVRFLPAYSPDFNPIELAFAKLKTHLRTVAARDYETLTTAIGTGLAGITPADAAAFYRHCGYHLPPQPL